MALLFSNDVVAEEEVRGIVSFNFDDGVKSQYDVAFLEMKKYGYSGTLFIMANRTGFFESVEKDKLQRLAHTGPEVRFVEQRIDEMKILLELSRKGEIPTRVTHNDTKISNVLLDENDNGLCVIDLDTVMPGLAHYDFGDAIRTATNTGAEDEADLDMVEMDIRLYEAYTRGYLKEMTGLNKTEIDFLPLAGKLFAYSQGMRFLKDYLDGDSYYKINHKEHNLQRTRAQFKLLVSMERQYDRMIEIVNNVSNEYSI